MIIPLAIAAAVIAVVAWVIVTHGDPRPRTAEGSRTRRRGRRRERGDTTPTPSTVTFETPAARLEVPPPISPAEPERPVRTAPDRGLVMSGGGEALTADGPVLAYLEQPRWAPRADRYLDSEVLVPEGSWYRLLALARLMVAILALGVAAGLGVILAARGMIWFVRSVLG